MSTLVVVGAVNVDMVVSAPHLPGPGETVVGPAVERYGGGKGANAAVAAARAGSPGITVRLLGAVGDDDLGRGALAELTAEGVDVEGVEVRSDVATGAALIVVDAAGENQIAVGAGANGRLEAAAIGDGIRACDATVVLVSTEIPPAAVRAAVEAAATLGVPCLLNPAPVLPELADLVRLGPILTPNAGELAELVRITAVWADADDPVASARALNARSAAPVVVTLGSDGVLVLDAAEGAGGGERRVPAEPVTVRDTTGAGDTFNGVLAARLVAGEALADAVELANHAAALSVGALGARGGMPTAGTLAARASTAG